MTTFFIGDIESIGAVIIGQTKEINKVRIRPFVNAERERGRMGDICCALTRASLDFKSRAGLTGLVHVPVG
jgi:hypothetical protein